MSVTERQKLYDRQYRLEHREHIREYHRAWRRAKNDLKALKVVEVKDYTFRKSDGSFYNFENGGYAALDTAVDEFVSLDGKIPFVLKWPGYVKEAVKDREWLEGTVRVPYVKENYNATD